MIYVYAPSMSIVTWAAKCWLWADITFISYNPAIIKFCTKSEIKFIKIKNNADTSFTGLVRHKKYVRKFAEQFTDCEFVFGHNSHDYWGLFFIDCVARVNKVYYNSQLEEHPKLSIFKLLFYNLNLRFVLDLIVLLIVTHQRFDVLSFGSNKFIGIDARRLEHKYDKHISNLMEDNYISNKKHVQAAYKLGNIRIILVDQGEAFYKYTIKLIDYIVFLSKKYDGFYLKQHPSFKTKNAELLDQLRQVPDEIPAELLVDEKTVLLGFASLTLTNSENSISLINFVDIDIKQYKNYLVFLKKRSNEIVFPKTLNGLEKILGNYNLF